MIDGNADNWPDSSSQFQPDISAPDWARSSSSSSRLWAAEPGVAAAPRVSVGGPAATGLTYR